MRPRGKSLAARVIGIAAASMVVVAASMVVAGVCIAPTVWAAEPRWTEISNEDGIRLFEREDRAAQRAAFRARGNVAANIYQVIGVLHDVPRHPQWIARCTEARRISRFDEYHYLVYSRGDAPWPVSDRDVVLRIRARMPQRHRRLVVRFTSTNDQAVPPVSGVVRMPWLRGRFEAVAVNPRETTVSYQVEADPGGWIPGWLANMVNRRIPRDTLLGLRRQVRRMRGRYRHQIAGWREAARGDRVPR